MSRPPRFNPLPAVQIRVLASLAAGATTGRGIVRLRGARTGQVHSVLDVLEDAGNVTRTVTEAEDGGPPRHTFQLTDQGRAYVQQFSQP